MNDKIFSTIIEQQRPCYFISPHFDDAILSAGALIEYLSKKTQVTIMNVFTRGGDKPYSLSAKKFLRMCGYSNSENLYEDRTKEDAAVFSALPVTVFNFPYVDGLWRKKENPGKLTQFMSSLLPEFAYVYPLYYFVTRGKISPHDQDLMDELTLSLDIIPNHAVVFCPLALGNHVDHVIVHTICSEMFANCVYWSDFPYNQKQSYQSMRFAKRLVFGEGLEKKRKRIEQYQTQYAALFPKNLSELPEEEYFVQQYE